MMGRRDHNGWPQCSWIILSILVLFCIAVKEVESNEWKLAENITGDTFFTHWTFWDQERDGKDPTQGYVYYANRKESWEFGLVNISSQGVYIGADYWNVAHGGRPSVRLTSRKSWNYGLFIADLSHMPWGCGTWPAWWLFGPAWPTSGEIDVIEGKNVNQQDQTTLHTTTGCTQSDTYYNEYFYGDLLSTDCDVYYNNNAGCGIVSPNNNSYGEGFNSIGGGVYALEWTNSSISSWFFERNNIPQDIIDNEPNPSSWPMPYAFFKIGIYCPNDHFKEMNMVIDCTFCGQWAGAEFPTDCPHIQQSCNDYVKYNPSEFAEAYWMFNYIRVYQ